MMTVEKEYVDSINNSVFEVAKRVDSLDDCVDNPNIPTPFKHIEEASFQLFLKCVKQAQLEMNTACLICAMWKNNVREGREKP